MRLILSFFPFPIDLISIFSRSFILEWRNRFKIMAPSIIPFFFVLLDILKRELSITKNRLSLKAALFLIVDDLRTLYYASIVAYSFNLCQSQSVPLHWRLHATQIMLIKRSNQVVLIYVLRKWVIQRSTKSLQILPNLRSSPDQSLLLHRKREKTKTNFYEFYRKSILFITNCTNKRI